MSKGLVEPSKILEGLKTNQQIGQLSEKLREQADPGGTPYAKVRVGYIATFDPVTWTCSAMIGDTLTEITGIQVLMHVQPMVEQTGVFVQTGGQGTTQYTLIGMLSQGSTGGGSVRVRKSADQAVTNSSTLGADSHLAFTAQSERSYIFEAQLFVRQNSTVATLDLNVGWVLPSGAVWHIGGAGPDIGIAAGGGTLVSASGNWRGLTDAPAGSKLAFGVEPAAVGGTYDSRIVSVFVAGSIKMGATSGLCSLAWCQNIGAAASTQIMAGSWLKVDATSELLP